MPENVANFFEKIALYIRKGKTGDSCKRFAGDSVAKSMEEYLRNPFKMDSVVMAGTAESIRIFIKGVISMKRFLSKKTVPLLLLVLLALTTMPIFAATNTPTPQSFSYVFYDGDEDGDPPPVFAVTRMQKMEVGSDPLMDVDEITYTGTTGSVPDTRFAVYEVADPLYGPDPSGDTRITLEKKVTTTGLHYFAYVSGYGTSAASEDRYYIGAYVNETMNGTLYFAGEWNV